MLLAKTKKGKYWQQPISTFTKVLRNLRDGLIDAKPSQVSDVSNQTTGAELPSNSIILSAVILIL